MTRPPSKQKLLYQQAWLKALREPDGLKLQFKTRAGAYEARRHLYEAVREAKEQPLEFAELFKAAEGIQVVWAGEASLWMRHRDSNDATTGMEAALGMRMADMEDAGALESGRRMLEQMEKLKGDSKPSPGEHQPNDFYGKRGSFDRNG